MKAQALTSVAVDINSALCEIKANSPNAWAAYKRKGKPVALVYITQGQVLKRGTLTKPLLKSLIIELGAVLECIREENRQGSEQVKVEKSGKRPWCVGDLAGLVGDMEAVDRTTKRRLKEDIREAHRWLFSRK